MRFHGLAITLIAVCATSALADDKDKLARIQATADVLGKAVFKGDYSTVADHTYPKLLDFAGGRDATIAMMKSVLEDTRKAGVALTGYTVGVPGKIYSGNGKEFVVVPTELTMSAPNAKVFCKSYLLGISTDAGKTWTFLDGFSGFDDEQIRGKVLPQLPPGLELPKKVTPRVVPDDPDADDASPGVQQPSSSPS